jgi:hypothetical protein
MLNETEDEKIERLEREAIAAENEIEIDEFEELLAAARLDLEVTGRYAGICGMCLNTGKVYKKQGKYGGFEYRKDNDSILYVVCTHGVDDSDSLSF